MYPHSVRDSVERQHAQTQSSLFCDHLSVPFDVVFWILEPGANMDSALVGVLFTPHWSVFLILLSQIVCAGLKPPFANHFTLLKDTYVFL